MISAERRERIKTILLERKSITVAEMAQLFEVSTETIRRDFEALSDEGFLVKSYGGATLAMRKNTIVSQRVKSGIMTDVKKEMAGIAVSCIKPNDCIFLDHSTTVFEMCEALADMPLTVMTNSLSVMNRFCDCPNIRLISPGGNFDVVSQAFFGLEAVGYLNRHCVDKAFLSCKTLDLKRGMNDADEMVAELRKSIVENSDYTYLLADHTKFGKTAFVQTCTLDRIDALITNRPLPEEWSLQMEEDHVEVMITDDQR